MELLVDAIKLDRSMVAVDGVGDFLCSVQSLRAGVLGAHVHSVENFLADISRSMWCEVRVTNDSSEIVEDILVF